MYVDIGISCDSCQGWFHSKCCGLTTERFSFYQKEENVDFKWFCLNCSSSIYSKIAVCDLRLNFLDDIQDRIRKLEDRTRNYDKVQEDLREALDKISALENKLAHQDEIFARSQTRVGYEISQIRSDHHALIENFIESNDVVSDLVKNQTATLKIVERLTIKQMETSSLINRIQESVLNSKIETRTLSAQSLNEEIGGTKNISELESKMKRSRNILLLNVPEPIENTSFRRRDADRRKANEILEVLKISQPLQLHRVHRVGKWYATQSDSSRCRPLLIELGSIRERDQILMRAHTLSTSLGSVKITGDYAQPRKLVKTLGAVSNMPASSTRKQIPKNGVRPRVIPARA
jgi:hypothetical protein